MDRLSIVSTLVVVSVLVGGLVIIMLSLGYYSWRPIEAAVALGLFHSWPAAYVIPCRIKRDAPN